MDIVLTAKHLCKSYTTGSISRTVLADIHLKIKKTEFVALMGPSGSGKSTLLYSLSGMDRFSSGSIALKSQELANLDEHHLSQLRLHAMGFIFQQIHLLKNLSIFDNIVFPAYLAKKKTQEEIDARALALMQQTHIADLAQHAITEVSGGQLQRAAICRALINDPEIVFGDEPTGALDSKSALEVMNILGDLNRSGTTLLIATHDSKVAARADRVIYIVDGAIRSEKILGKFQTMKQSEEREKELITWIETLINDTSNQS